MKKSYVAILSLTSALAACKTTSNDNSGSQLHGGAYQEISNLRRATTDEQLLEKINKRLNDINRYVSVGDIATTDNCPAAAANDPCGLVNIMIEFETPGSGSVGHTGVAIRRPQSNASELFDQYYDFGPGKDTIDGKKVKVGDPGIHSLPPGQFDGLFDGVPGTQWWDNQHRFDDSPHPSQIGMKEVIENIDRFANDYTVIRIPICTTKAHAELIARYWVKSYMNMPTYRIPGNHCTSMVAQSWESTFNAGQRLGAQSTFSWAVETLDQYVPNPREIKRWITSPTTYAERVLSGNYSGTLDYRHQCGQLKGKQPKAIVVRTESLFKEQSLEQYVKWTEDRSTN